MNDRAFGNKVDRDFERTKRDLTALGEDGMAGVSRKFEQLTGGAKKTMSDAAEAFNKEIGQSLSQYNDKVQEVADRVPGGFGKKARGYPWVVVTVALVFGLMLGAFLKPSRQNRG